jgi:predicted P-loop ATPase
VKWWPDSDFETKDIQPEQDARNEVDVWEQVIADYLNSWQKVTILEIARGPLQIETPRIGTAAQRRIAAILERLGWKRQPKDSKGNIPWTKL